MILRRYGNRVQSVRPNFDGLALTEIGFMRDHMLALANDEFAVRYERVAGHELRAEAEGDVQRDVEDAVLADLQSQLEALVRGLGSSEVLLVENDDTDRAKTHGRQTTRVVGTENRYHFHYHVDPPLRIGVYRRRSPPA
jgi:hypothetical protein